MQLNNIKSKDYKQRENSSGMRVMDLMINENQAGKLQSKHSPFEAVKSMATVKWIWVLKNINSNTCEPNDSQESSTLHTNEARPGFSMLCVFFFLSE